MTHDIMAHDIMAHDIMALYNKTSAYSMHQPSITPHAIYPTSGEFYIPQIMTHVRLSHLYRQSTTGGYLEAIITPPKHTHTHTHYKVSTKCSFESNFVKNILR